MWERRRARSGGSEFRWAREATSYGVIRTGIGWRRPGDVLTTFPIPENAWAGARRMVVLDDVAKFRRLGFIHDARSLLLEHRMMPWWRSPRFSDGFT